MYCFLVIIEQKLNHIFSKSESPIYEGFAPESANKLKKLFGQKIIAPDALEDQPSLF